VTDLLDGMTAAVFDFFGTLTPISPDEVWASNAARLAAVFGVPAQALDTALVETFGDRMTGAMGDVRQTMQGLAERLGARLTEGQLDEAIAVRRRAQESMFALRTEALPVIGNLRERGLKIGLVSDCSSELPDAWHRLPLAPLVDAPVFSCVEGIRKPDPRLFLTVAGNLGVSPADCVYIGDGGGRELTGSSAVGMRAVLLAGPDWRQHHAHDQEYNWAGARIGSLTELLRGEGKTAGLAHNG
jgi:putative hydrolase of the HAD superfamily